MEDDKDIRESIRDVLEMEGYSVAAYSNGKEALEGVRGCGSPCLILLDLMMPVMDGWQFLKQRQKLGDTIVAIPVFIVSAVADQSVTALGAKGYVKKPLDIDVLLKLVRNHCGEAEMQMPAKKAA